MLFEVLIVHPYYIMTYSSVAITVSKIVSIGDEKQH